MRLGDGNQFDVSDADAPVDAIDAILDVAAEVLGEYGPEQGQTRIERLARWVALRVGDVTLERGEVLERVHGISVRAGGPYDDDRVWVTSVRAMCADDARALACLLLRAAERADAATYREE